MKVEGYVLYLRSLWIFTNTIKLLSSWNPFICQFSVSVNNYIMSSLKIILLVACWISVLCNVNPVQDQGMLSCLPHFEASFQFFHFLFGSSSGHSGDVWISLNSCHSQNFMYIVGREYLTNISILFITLLDLYWGTQGHNAYSNLNSTVPLFLF